MFNIFQNHNRLKKWFSILLITGLLAAVAFLGSACSQGSTSSVNKAAADNKPDQKSSAGQTATSDKNAALLAVSSSKVKNSPAPAGKQSSIGGGESFVFDVMGDSKILPGREKWRGNMVLAEAVKQINQDEPALVVYLGDGADQGGPVGNLTAFKGYLEKLKSPWYPVIGNHELKHGARPDGRGGNGEGNFRQVFAGKLLQGKSYYSFDYLNSHFIVLDTAWQTGDGPPDAELKPGSQQWVWLCQDLAAARQKSQHIFIFGHKPPVSPYHAGGPDTATNLPDGHGSSWGDPRAAVEFMNLAVKYKVDAVFSGHIHMYNRLDIKGVPYIITAGAGANLYAAPEQGGYYHYMRCRVSEGQVTYEVVKLKVSK